MCGKRGGLIFYYLPILLPVLLFSTIVSAQSTVLSSTGWHNQTITHGNRSREFRYYIPTNLQENPPLVMLFHGGTQNMHKLFKKHAGGSKQWPLLAEEHGFILMTPNGSNPINDTTSGKRLNWNDCRTPDDSSERQVSADDVGFINRLVEWSRLSLSTTHVFVTGASNGGMMSYRIALELADHVTAVAAFIANLPVVSQCNPQGSPIPMMIVNGTDDPVMPWVGGEIRGKGGNVMSAEDTFSFWIQNNRSDQSNPKVIEFKNKNKKDKSTLTGKCFPANTDEPDTSAQTCVYTVKGGGHVTPSIKHKTPRWIQKRIIGWQNQDIEGANLAWKFFESYIH